MANVRKKITFADMRDMGVRGVIYCADYRSHLITLSGDPTPRPFVA